MSSDLVEFFQITITFKYSRLKVEWIWHMYFFWQPKHGIEAFPFLKEWIKDNEGAKQILEVARLQLMKR